MPSRDAAVDWEATAFWALALPPALYCFALILCIVGFVLAVRWRVDRHVGKFFGKVYQWRKILALTVDFPLHQASESFFVWCKLRQIT